MTDDRYSQLLKMYEEGLVDLEDLVPKSKNINKTTANVRDLYEGALGQQYLKDTGISMPRKNASTSSMETFLNKLKEEQYPELSDVDVS